MTGVDLDKPRTPRRRSDDNVVADRRHPEAMEARINARMAEFEARIDAKLDANTAMTAGVVELFNNLAAGIKVIGGLGTFAKWLAPIVTLGVALWAIITGRPLDK